MSYGLYDGDYHLYPQIPFFNLELMKYATYYKHRREIVVFTPKFTPNMYGHYIVRQDYLSNHMYSMQYKNVVYGGRAFDGGIYKPLPMDIELCKPDTSIYNKLESQLVINAATKNSFSTMRRAEHVRLSLDGQHINPDWEKQLRKDTNTFGLILHDYNLGQIEGAKELITDFLPQIIANKAGVRIGMKFPTQVNSEEELLQWLNIPPLNRYYSLQYNGILTINHAQELVENRHQSAAQTQLLLNVTSHNTYENFIKIGIIQLFKSILDLRRYKLFFPLIYDKTFFTDQRWVKVLDLFNFFIAHIKNSFQKDEYYEDKISKETLYSCVKREITKNKHGHTSYLTKKEAQQIFQFVREQNYDLFKMFYEYTGELK